MTITNTQVKTEVVTKENIKSGDLFEITKTFRVKDRYHHITKFTKGKKAMARYSCGTLVLQQMDNTIFNYCYVEDIKDFSGLKRTEA